jgi:glycosyltransferase involved in cell wall biosynthesis
LRIIYLHQYFNTPSMAGGTRSYEMARRLVAAGHDVQLVTSDRSGSGDGWYETEEAGIRVHWLPVRYSNAMTYRERLRAFGAYALAAGPKATALGGDIVFATSTPLTIAIPAVYASKRLGAPMVFEVRDLWPEMPIAVGAIRGPLKGPARWLARFAYRNAAQVVALSPGMRDGVVRYGYPPERVHVIPNGSDLDLFAPDPVSAARFRRSREWLRERQLVLYAGTLGRVNGVDYLARLAAEVLPLAPEVRFLIIGSGQEESKVRDEAARLGVLDRNFFMLGRQPKREVRNAFAAATLSTSCFIDLEEMWSNSANKFFDSLASGTPVAINYGGWQASLLEQYGAGLVLAVDDMAAARDRLLEALADSSWLKRAGAAARRLAEEKFSRDLLAGRLEGVLLRAVSAPPEASVQRWKPQGK